MDPLLKYFPLVKVDEATHTVWGIVTSETPDSEKEICDYSAAKEAIKTWSDDTLAKTTAAGQDPSLGNMRVMHQLQIGGKAIKIEYRDDVKQVWVGSEPADDAVWHLLKGGFLTAHSIGGSYAWKRAEGEYTRYAPTIGEISYVDKGANPDASFSYVKADGTTELRKFVKPGPTEIALLQKIKSAELAKLSDDDIERITKAALSQLDTQLQKFRDEITSSVGQHTTAIGGNMKPEDIRKCAAALGITEEEFTKKYVAELQKAKGLAALHAHLETMHGHHEAMGKAHHAMGAMHEKMGSHIEKCMKACKSVMGSDDGEAEKALKALVDELKGSAATETPEEKSAREALEKKAKEGTMSADEIQKAIEAGVKKAIGELPAPDKSGLTMVPREGLAKKAAEAVAASSPYGL